MKKHKLLIGRAEMVSFPELFIDTIPAKIDSGAYRSAIHATDVRIAKKNNKQVLKFTLLGGHSGSPYTREMEVAEFEKTMVENSFGTAEERYVISLKMKVGPRLFKTQFTLADRSKKTYPVLIGRKSTNGRFFIDTALTNVDRKKLKALKIDSIKDDEDFEV